MSDLNQLITNLSEFQKKVSELQTNIEKQKLKDEELDKEKKENELIKQKTQIIKERLALLDDYSDLEAQLLERDLATKKRLERIREKYDSYHFPVQNNLSQPPITIPPPNSPVEPLPQSKVSNIPAPPPEGPQMPKAPSLGPRQKSEPDLFSLDSHLIQTIANRRKSIES